MGTGVSVPSRPLLAELANLVQESAAIRQGSMRDHVWWAVKALPVGELAQEWTDLRSRIGEEAATSIIEKLLIDPSYGRK